MKFGFLFLTFFPSLALANCANNDLYQKLKHLDCSPKEIHLTFDDGPRAATTPVILEELQRRNIKATFFVSTSNLDSPENKKIVMDLINKGQYIASHGHDHKCYDHRYSNATKEPIETPFTQAQREEQIQKSDRLLDEATQGKFSKQKMGKFFRFPYGRGAMPSEIEIEVMRQKGMEIKGSSYREKLDYYRTHSPAMSSISEYGYNHMGWNFDSHDSSLGAEVSDHATVEKYLKENLIQMCQSHEKILIALYHDIKKLNANAIGTLIDTAQCLGMSFVSTEEALKKRQTLINNGVVINKYELSTDRVGELLTSLEEVNTKPQLTCEKPRTDLKKGCLSVYTDKEIPHCQGDDSICIDGKFFAKGTLIPHEECGYALDKLKVEINQKRCPTPSESRVIVPEKIKCYCQEDGKEELRWNCYDISEVPAKKI
ncbi:MAG: polysaccharide deacetylase family protein [Bacteriovoracaceae bacterium]